MECKSTDIIIQFYSSFNVTVRIKVPFVRNLKNEIIKFYDKLGFKASFALISERILLVWLY